VPTVLRKLPYFPHASTIEVRGATVKVKAHQIIIWVSLSDARTEQLPRDWSRFPALLDTGLGHNFLIHEQHLTQWAGIVPQSLLKFGYARVWGHRVDKRDATLWLHPNLPNERDRFTDRAPFRVELNDGILVIPDSAATLTPIPRLPLLGLPALQVPGGEIAAWPVEAPMPVETRRLEENEKIGRNDPCWCGSGKKFKKCHGA
jgi:hypothetical protein